MPANFSPVQLPGKNAILRWIGRGMILVACIVSAPFLCVGLFIGGAVITHPGIGDVERAQHKIHEGMTKGEVRAVLGKPHRINDDGAEWRYWETFDVGCVLRVHFGGDGRVASTDWYDN